MWNAFLLKRKYHFSRRISSWEKSCLFERRLSSWETRMTPIPYLCVSFWDRFCFMRNTCFLEKKSYFLQKQIYIFEKDVALYERRVFSRKAWFLEKQPLLLEKRVLSWEKLSFWARRALFRVTRNFRLHFLCVRDACLL